MHDDHCRLYTCLLLHALSSLRGCWQEMDAKKAQIKELNDQVRDSGNKLRQLQKGASSIRSWQDLLKMLPGKQEQAATQDVVQSCKA